MKLFFKRRRTHKAVTQGGYSYSLVADERIVLCTLYGYITRQILDEVLVQNKHHTDQLAANGKPTLLATNISGVTGVSPEARSKLQNLHSYTVDRSAVYGASPFITLITQYVVRMSQNRTRLFRTKREAIDWLLDKQLPKRRNAMARLLTILPASSGILVLYGWFTQNPHLQSLGFVSDPRNPVIALNLTVLSIALFVLAMKPSKAVNWPIRVFAAWLVVFGFFIAFGAFTGVSTNLDAWLFTEHYRAIGSPAAPTTVAVVLGILGLVLWLLTTSLKKIPGRAFRFLMISAFLVTIYMLVLQGLGVPQPKVVGACGALLSLEIAIVLFTHREPSRFPTAYKLITQYWPSMAIFAVMITATLFAWQVAQRATLASELTQISDAVSVDLNANEDVLRSFKALYQSSSFVEASEFNSFFTESGLQQNHPGLSVVGFLRGTTDANGNTAYPLTYLTPQSEHDNYGLNLAAYPPAFRLLNQSRDSGQPVADDNIGIPSIAPQESQGLFIAEAVYTPDMSDPITIAGKRKNLYGFIVAQFNYQKFFQHFFEQHSIGKNTALIATDQSSKNIVHYQSKGAMEAKDRRVVFTEPITIAGHELDLSILSSGSIATGLSEGPNTVLLAGIAVSILLAVSVALLVRRRYQALKLAEVITEDLEEERSNAVAAAQKDEAILASIGDGLVTIDNDGKIILVNDRFKELLGREGENVAGKYLTDIAPLQDSQGRLIPDSRRVITKVLHQNKKEVILMRDGLHYVRKDKSTFPAAGTVTPIARNGKVVGAIEIVRDVTLEASIDRAKTEFVSLASHQLRTPLTAAKWYSELLLDEQVGKLKPGQEKYVQKMRDAVLRTIKLVSALLNLSRVEMGSIAIEPEEVNVTKLAQNIVKDLKPQISEHQLRVTEHYPDKKLVMTVDPRLMRIMIENLVTNAIKYTPDKGVIEISISKKAGEVLIEVRDTGYGIPQNQQDKIFTKLFRADNIRSKTTEGVGLGLYLVRAITDFVGGDVWFESVENEGTTFHIRIPATGMKRRSGKEIIL